MASTDTRVRPAKPGDESGWKRLWDGYLRFYEHEVPAETTAATWQRITDDEVAHMGALIAEDETAGAVGMLNFVVHDITWSISPVCYLEDLFVEEEHRGRGVARALIDHLVEMGRSEGWHRIYLHTARDNVQAQKLYNKVSERTGWVRYDIDLT